MEYVQLCGNECANINWGDHFFTLWHKRLWFFDSIWSPASLNEDSTLYVPWVKDDGAMAEVPGNRNRWEDVGKAPVEEKKRQCEAQASVWACPIRAARYAIKKLKMWRMAAQECGTRKENWSHVGMTEAKSAGRKNEGARERVMEKWNWSRTVQNRDDVSVDNASAKEIGRLKRKMMWKQEIWENEPQLVIGI
jgi:hypothetical protein